MTLFGFSASLRMPVSQTPIIIGSNNGLMPYLYTHMSYIAWDISIQWYPGARLTKT